MVLRSRDPTRALTGLPSNESRCSAAHEASGAMHETSRNRMFKRVFPPTSNRLHIRRLVRRPQVRVILAKPLVDKVLGRNWDLLLEEQMRQFPGGAAVASRI